MRTWVALALMVVAAALVVVVAWVALAVFFTLGHQLVSPLP